MRLYDILISVNDFRPCARNLQKHFTGAAPHGGGGGRGGRGCVSRAESSAEVAAGRQSCSLTADCRAVGWTDVEHKGIRKDPWV